MDLNRWTTPGMNSDDIPNKFKRAYREMVAEGHIGLQDHWGKIWFRELKVREIQGQGSAKASP